MTGVKTTEKKNGSLFYFLREQEYKEIENRRKMILKSRRSIHKAQCQSDRYSKKKNERREREKKRWGQERKYLKE